MSTQKNDIKDWYRGTTHPLTLNISDADGYPYPLIGSTLVFVVRSEAWEDSSTDSTAVMKKRATFYKVANAAAIPTAISSPKAGDMVWITDVEAVKEYDGTAWVEAIRDENLLLDGMYTIRMKRSETMVPVGTYYYSVDIKFATGDVEKLVYGKIKLAPNTVNEV